MSQTWYTEDHEWIRVENGTGTVGITDHAQQELGDVVYVELPPPGRSVSQGEAAAVVESVKAAADVKAPVSGTVREVNAQLADNPQLVNESPLAEGWFFRMTVADESELKKLMDEAAYRSFIAK